MTDAFDRLKTALADRYTIKEEIGAGGMATVYLAEDLKHHRKVAVKVLRPELSAAIGPERFLREIEISANLNHPHILPLFDSGEADGFLYYVMPFVEGESLRDRINREKQLPVEDAVKITSEVATALSFAHSHDVIHRDIKPENILLEAGIAVVADFGIAKAIHAAGGEQLTETGMSVGTPPYMSPEQASGSRDLEGRSDLYSLGCVLYEMLGGEPPFTGATVESIVHQHIAVEPRPVTALRPAVSAVVVAALSRVLSKAPADRFNTAAQFAGALGTPTTGESPAKQGPPDRSIAVIPFINMSPDPENEYFSDGLTEELIDALSKVEGLSVASRTSAFRFKGQAGDIRKIGEELNVANLLEGSVRHAGGRLRANAQLIKVSDGYHLWSEKYDRALEDVFAVQEEIAQAIVRELKVMLVGEEQTRIVKQRTEVLEAYDFYLKGRFFWYKRTDESFIRAKEYFESAVAHDPKYALAYAGLADVYALVGIAEYGILRPHEMMLKAKEAAQRAIALDSSLAEAHTTIAHVAAFYDWDWGAADEAFRRAVEMNEDYPMSHHWHALYLAAMGRPEEALEAQNRALALEPMSLIINKNVGTILYYARRYDDAVAQYLRTLELDPTFVRTHYYLGLAYEQQGLAEEAVAEFQKATELSGGNTVCSALFAHACATAGDEDRARQVRDELLAARGGRGEEGGHRYVPAFNIALASLGLGDIDEAFDWLNTALDERSSWLVSLNVEPLFDAIRSDPRFADLVERVGLPS